MKSNATFKKTTNLKPKQICKLKKTKTKTNWSREKKTKSANWLNTKWKTKIKSEKNIFCKLKSNTKKRKNKQTEIRGKKRNRSVGCSRWDNLKRLIWFGCVWSCWVTQVWRDGAALLPVVTSFSAVFAQLPIYTELIKLVYHLNWLIWIIGRFLPIFSFWYRKTTFSVLRVGGGFLLAGNWLIGD